ncbi:MAG TPA: hypothetical protein VGH28_07110 [Polyangiaceae bacterium]|jgi:hypothetical protein
MHLDTLFASAFFGGLVLWLVSVFAADSYLRKHDPFHDPGVRVTGGGGAALIARLFLSLGTMKRYVGQRRNEGGAPTWVFAYVLGLLAMFGGALLWSL